MICPSYCLHVIYIRLLDGWVILCHSMYFHIRHFQCLLKHLSKRNFSLNLPISDSPGHSSQRWALPKQQVSFTRNDSSGGQHRELPHSPTACEHRREGSRSLGITAWKSRWAFIPTQVCTMHLCVMHTATQYTLTLLHSSLCFSRAFWHRRHVALQALYLMCWGPNPQVLFAAQHHVLLTEIHAQHLSRILLLSRPFFLSSQLYELYHLSSLCKESANNLCHSLVVSLNPIYSYFFNCVLSW